MSGPAVKKKRALLLLLLLLIDSVLCMRDSFSFGVLYISYAQPVSKRQMSIKSKKFHGNILRRGSVPDSLGKKTSSFTVGPVLLAFFLFVVVGSGTTWVFGWRRLAQMFSR